MAAWPGVAVTCYDPGYAPFAEPCEGTFDGVITTDVLEHIPEEDIGWVLCTQEKSLLVFEHRPRLNKKGIRSRFFAGRG